MSYSLNLSAYPDATPESVVYQFLEGWKSKKWAGLLKATQKSWVVAQDDPLEALKSILSYNLKGYKALNSIKLNEVVHAITVILSLSIARGVVQNKTVTIRTIKEVQPLLPSPEGEWGVNPITAVMEIFNETED